MKIAIPLDDTKAAVCVAFARAPYFLFFNTDTNTNEILANPASEAQGGAGLKAAQYLVDNNANALITVRCGENAAEVLKEADIEIYKAEDETPSENIAKLCENKLQPLTKFHAGFHGIGGQ